MHVNMKVNSSNLKPSGAEKTLIVIFVIVTINWNIQKNRFEKLDTIVQRLYEDNLESKNSSDESFIRMSVTDDTAQKLLKHRLILRQAKN